MMQSPLSVPTMYDAISPISAYEFEQVSNFSHDAFLLINDSGICVLVFWASYIPAIQQMAGVFGYALQYSGQAQSG